MSDPNHAVCVPQPETTRLDHPFLDTAPQQEQSQICHVRPKALSLTATDFCPLTVRNREGALETVLSRTVHVYGVSRADIMGKDRHKTPAAARHVAMWALRQRFGYSYPELGRMFGGKDHSSVMSACRRVDVAVAAFRICRGAYTEKSEMGAAALEVLGLGQFDTATGTSAGDTSSSESSARTQASEVPT